MILGFSHPVPSYVDLESFPELFSQLDFSENTVWCFFKKVEFKLRVYSEFRYPHHENKYSW
jgi:hypothetical protein